MHASCDKKTMFLVCRPVPPVALVVLTTILVCATTFTLGYHDNDDSASERVSSTYSRLLTLINEDEELPPLFPFRTQDYLGFGSAILCLLLAAGGGIGGGGILVPVYILILEFPVKHAIPLASATVLGGAVANNILNARKKHPDHPLRPAIDWDLILQLEPMTILGALFGAALTDLLPEVVLVVLMVLLLTVTANKTLSTAQKLHVKESEQLLKAHGEGEAKKLLANADDYIEHYVGLQRNDNTKTDDDGSWSSDEKVSNAIQTLEQSAGEPSWRDDCDHQVFLDAAKLSALFALITFINLLKGNVGEDGGGPMGLNSCGAGCFWISQIIILFLIVAFSVWVRWGVLKRLKDGGPVLSEIEWDEKNTIIYPLLAIVAGLVAGMFGIGGGIIKGPLMLALGVHPAVASATSACMILFTSCTSTVSFMIFGLLVYDYAWFCLLVGFFSTLVGQTVMTILMQRYQRNSYIAYSIGFVVGLSAIAMSIESVLAIVKGQR